MTNVEIIKKELENIKYPGFAKSIVEFGFVKEVQLDGNNCFINLDITSTAPEVEAQLRKEITALKSLSGINVTLNFNKPKEQVQQSNSVSGKNIAPQIKKVVMVSSGKGGVGKSTTTVNLAIATAMQGKRVGILDADIYGPNIPRMMGLNGKEVEIVGDKAKPLNAYGVDVMSMGILMEEGQALIWRGAMIMKAIQQLLRDILWEELDILFIDMPPGTGDAQLTLAQSVPVSAGINVTTPQHVALDDSRRSLDMFKKLHIPVAGIVENMSGFICPSCKTESDIFGMGTCEELAKQYNTQVLGNLPIEPAIREGGDSGKPIVYFNPESISAKRYMIAADKLISFLNSQDEVSNAAIQPIMPAGVSACSPEGQKIKEEHEKAQKSSGSCGTGCGCH
ncbi:MAG: Mrp/NBP35 family ATP-binding protein [Arcobacter sp.]|jgi:ATP-binding protein involved in chromosome partitioning|uniref:Iron-sulfur cluster carrier protein n=1 Tax=Arcobacter defluvii TaxID=873191 RepID=A0AAE7BDZ1_9BACT|nr:MULTISPECIES: Mrp/NBP35 family ATP-binding protein [Arcobacter]MDY3200266.1 Mrp/NBP35 family ATP-binding protein [Arcobacter sp.]QKF76272.1 ATP/GTP-binding protein [Arcobacter defluvii]RXI30954.1 ATP-binding protein [Arcobacter defluvii]BAK72084.1 ATP/GTP-binding protein [Arcobacter sp. L]